MELENLYKLETGEIAFCRKGESNYYTITYVMWLENRYKELASLFKKAKHIIDVIGDTVDIDFIMKPIFNFKA